MILRAGQASNRSELSANADSEHALNDLCRIYWYPVYAFARRQGIAAENAQDLVQAFFLDLLERGSLAVASPERGRFRNFLLTSFRNFHSKQRERGNALKRGGGKTIVSFETEEAEQRFGLTEGTGGSPEQHFLREWTLDLLKDSLAELRKTYLAREQIDLFDALQDYLADTVPPPYEDVAQKLGKSVGSVRVALHRLRGRYRSAVRAAVANTLEDSSDANIERELAELTMALSFESV